jgi:hypothetical protein
MSKQMGREMDAKPSDTRGWIVGLFSATLVIVGNQLGFTHLGDWWVYALAGVAFFLVEWTLRRLGWLH